MTRDWLPNRIEALVMDFDGVHTTNSVIQLPDGTEAVMCNRADGYGIQMLRESGLKMVIISGEVNPVGRMRAEKLQVQYIGCVRDKAPLLVEWSQENNVNLDNAIYIGNDANDVECMKIVGCAVAPADAQRCALDVPGVVRLGMNGGQGALRQLAEMILGTP